MIGNSLRQSRLYPYDFSILWLLDESSAAKTNRVINKHLKSCHMIRYQKEKTVIIGREKNVSNFSETIGLRLIMQRGNYKKQGGDNSLVHCSAFNHETDFD